MQPHQPLERDIGTGHMRAADSGTSADAVAPNLEIRRRDGEPLPTPIEASGDPGARTALLKTVIREQGIAIEYADELGGALGTSSGGCIRLLNGLSPAMEFTTLVHEHAHLCKGIAYVRFLLVTGRPRHQRL